MEEEIVLQTNGNLYASELIDDRYQVLESETPKDTFYVVDHSRLDLVVSDENYRTIRFASKQMAVDWIKGFTSASGSDINPNPTGASPGGYEEKDTMARSPKANAAAVKAATAADKSIGGKGGVKAAVKTAKADKQPVAATGRGSVKATPAAAERLPAATGIKSVANRTGTMAHMFRDLIANQAKLKLTDEAIHEKVEAQFGKKIPSNAVAHYRADVEKRQAAGAAI